MTWTEALYCLSLGPGFGATRICSLFSRTRFCSSGCRPLIATYDIFIPFQDEQLAPRSPSDASFAPDHLIQEFAPSIQRSLSSTQTNSKIVGLIAMYSYCFHLVCRRWVVSCPAEAKAFGISRFWRRWVVSCPKDCT